MKTLIVEDDMTSRLLMQKYMKGYGPYHTVDDGYQAVEAVRSALRNQAPFDLICLDIMMPKMDGQTALHKIRELEASHGVTPESRAKIIMTTALADRDNVLQACQHQCDHYLIKPIEKVKLLETMLELGLLPAPEESAEDTGPGNDSE